MLLVNQLYTNTAAMFNASGNLGNGNLERNSQLADIVCQCIVLIVPFGFHIESVASDIFSILITANTLTFFRHKFYFIHFSFASSAPMKRETKYCGTWKTVGWFQAYYATFNSYNTSVNC